MGRRITCITKGTTNNDNLYLEISKLGYTEDSTAVSSMATREQMYDWVKNGGFAYVLDTFGNRATLICEISQNGVKYVRTKPDGVKSDNLLSLPLCKV